MNGKSGVLRKKASGFFTQVARKERKEAKKGKQSRIGNIRMQTCIPAIFFVFYESTVI